VTDMVKYICPKCGHTFYGWSTDTKCPICKVELEKKI
jgi:rubrerythrin